MIKRVLAGLAVLAVVVPGLALADGVRLAGAYDRVVVTEDDDAFVKIRFNGPDDAEKTESGGGNWGGFGGAMVEWVWLDLSALEPMTEDRRISNFPSQIVLIGGQGGFIYQDWRFGGFGFGNSYNTARKVGGSRRSADMTIGGGGVMVEYNHAVNSMVGVNLGALLGAGSINLEASGRDLSAAGTKDSWSANQSFFLAEPYVGVWFAPVKFVWVELTGGYVFFGFDGGLDRYEHNNGVTDIEMVDGNINGGWQAAIKVNFGLNPNL